ncbi:MAG TPA: hypothetical protein VHB74_10845 [Devosia sp.]|nr:hypothetical protein [Devosia sp.]
MRKLLTAGAAMVALTLSAGAILPARADDTGAAIAGGVVGFMAGAMAGSQAAPPRDLPPRRDLPPPPPPSHFGRAWRIHVAACDDRWGDRYDPRTDLVHWRGRVFPCEEGMGGPPPPPPGPPRGYYPPPPPPGDYYGPPRY